MKPPLKRLEKIEEELKKLWHRKNVSCGRTKEELLRKYNALYEKYRELKCTYGNI